MSKVIFSLVLFEHTIECISPLLDSLLSLSRLLDGSFSVVLYVCDNSPNSSQLIDEDIRRILGNILCRYSRNSFNIGFGLANNSNFLLAGPSDDDFFVVVNPDIYFEACELDPLFHWIDLNRGFSCVAPLVLNEVGAIQYTAKKNPTLLSLALGRLGFLCNLPILSKYDRWHKNMTHDYCSDCFQSSYLSGSFLVIPSWAYRRVNGFSVKYFLHLEDADIVRRLSLIGSTVHNPIGKVVHLWARGSHKSLSQTIHLLHSMFTYFSIWGFRLF